MLYPCVTDQHLNQILAAYFKVNSFWVKHPLKHQSSDGCLNDRPHLHWWGITKLPAGLTFFNDLCQMAAAGLIRVAKEFPLFIRQALPNKNLTYPVETDNAEIRHYLARLARI